MISKTIFLLFILNIINPFSFAQDKEKPINIPSFIIHNKFTNKESHTLIRWVSWTDDQKLKIHTYAQEQNKSFEKIQLDVAQQIQKLRDALATEEEKAAFNEKKKTAELMGNTQGELAIKVKVYIESLLTEEQKKEFADKQKNAALMKAELEKNLAEFDQKTKQLNAAPFNEHFYHVLTSSTKYIHTPEIWALTRTPLTADEKTSISNMLNKLMQTEQGYHLATEKTSEELNISNGYCLFDFNMKKDFGTETLHKEIKNFSKQNQEIFNSLLAHYNNQKKSLLAIYQKYGEKTKFEIPMSPPRIVDETNK
jgi:Spy/CpxP family protein refolding chaperone